MIAIKNIEKSFGDTKILKGVSTVFETGKTNLIIGKSGSGKQFYLNHYLEFTLQRQEPFRLMVEYIPNLMPMKNGH